MSNSNKPMSEYADDFLGDHERSHVLANLARQSPKDRAAQREETINKPSKCPSCGSTWFRDETFNQYRAETYSSRAGGELEVISEMPQTLRVCLCGAPLPPNVGGALHGGITPSANMDSFGKSLKAALAYLGGLGADPVPTVQSMLKNALTQGTFAEMMEAMGAKVTSLENQVLEIRTAPAGGKRA
jgi:hypothetical protein